ncbi:MAG: DUF2149 domain-containing protein [Planctomycetes bacterium]|nr:DUF2149 domain-containing protein [Planctomycetota bacterium]
MRRRRRGKSLLDGEDVDPLAFVPNLFDAILVLVVALLVALSSAHGRAERSPQQTERLEGFVDTGVRRAGDGRRLGVAYRLADGKVVYVPE